jgi:hypothetical protein
MNRLLAAPLSAEVQQAGKMYRIAFLGASVTQDTKSRDQETPQRARLDPGAEKAGVSKNYITLLKTGTRKSPSLPVLKRLAKALGVPVTELLG